MTDALHILPGDLIVRECPPNEPTPPGWTRPALLPGLIYQRAVTADVLYPDVPTWRIRPGDVT